MIQASLFPAEVRFPCIFSPCGRYRYLLRAEISSLGKGVCLWVLANSSKGNEQRLDPTLTRCADYTERWGFGEMRVVNARAWIATNPKDVPADPLAIGPDNDGHIIEQAAQARLVVCGWGKLGGERGTHILKLLRPYCVPHALVQNGDGSPSHPLYLRKDLKPFPLEVA